MPGYDVFLSYSRADSAAAASLRTRLDQDAGLKAFLDRYLRGKERSLLDSAGRSAGSQPTMQGAKH